MPVNKKNKNKNLDFKNLHYYKGIIVSFEFGRYGKPTLMLLSVVMHPAWYIIL